MNNLVIVNNYATYGEAGLKSNQIIYYKEDDYFKLRTNLSDDPFAPSEVVTLVKEGAGGGGLEAVIAGKSTHWSIPSDITTIPAYLLAGVSNLESVSFEHTIGISAYAFNNSHVSRINSEEEGTIDLSNVGATQGYVFEKASGIKKVIIDTNKMNKISYRDFALSSVEEVVFVGNKLQCIFPQAFQGSSLKKIDLSAHTNLPNPYVNPHGIMTMAFDSCSQLTEIKLPSSLQSIDNGLISNCTSLTYIDIPTNCSSIASGAFTNTPLEIVNFGNTRTTIPTITTTSFTIGENTKFVVPDAKYDQWKAANVWKTAGIVEHIYPYSEIYNE